MGTRFELALDSQGLDSLDEGGFTGNEVLGQENVGYLFIGDITG